MLYFDQRKKKTLLFETNRILEQLKIELMFFEYQFSWQNWRLLKFWWLEFWDEFSWIDKSFEQKFLSLPIIVIQTLSSSVFSDVVLVILSVENQPTETKRFVCFAKSQWYLLTFFFSVTDRPTDWERERERERLHLCLFFCLFFPP